MKKVDFLIVGGGVVGLSVARELKARRPKASVTLIEKDARCGLHGSGRNSGVLHAGFYYTADSLKARFTLQGNRLLRAYCARRSIPINQCGKLVVARDAADLPQMDELLRRGAANGVELQPMTAPEARAIEPRVKTCERALFSPATATVDPSAVMAALLEDAGREGIEILTGAPFLKREGDTIKTGGGEFQAGYVVNAAGLYADKVAREFGFSEHYRILPFKGLYLYSDEPAGALKTNIYPVPDLKNPFLGVHFTIRTDGRIKIGPTAIPAFWREHYTGFENFNLSEFAELIWRELGLVASANFDFKRLAVEEMMKYSRRRMVALASKLADGVQLKQYRTWGQPGLRAQLMDIRTRKLEMDFVIEGDARSMHILNAVSPAFTCSMPFARHVCDQIDNHLGTLP